MRGSVDRAGLAQWVEIALLACATLAVLPLLLGVRQLVRLGGTSGAEPR